MLEVHTPSRQVEPSPSDRWILLGFGLTFGGLLLAEIVRDFHPVKLSALFVFLSWWPLIAVHELSHAVVARLLGWRVSRIVVGFGRRVAGFRIGGVDVELRLYPLEGFVLPSPKDLRLVRLKSALIYFAGPGVELLLILIILLVLGSDRFFQRSEDVGLVAAQSVALAAAVGVVLNLLPLHVSTGAGTAVSDGLGILQSPFLADCHFQGLMAAPYLVEAEPCMAAGDWDGALRAVDKGLGQLPGHPQLTLLLAAVRRERGELPAARASLRDVALRDDLSGALRAEASSQLAALDIALGSDELLEEALTFSARAVELEPDDVLVLARRAGVLVESGRYHEAMEILESALRRTRTPGEEEECLAYLALAEFERGNTSEAGSYLDLLTRRGAEGWLVRWVEEELRK